MVVVWIIACGALLILAMVLGEMLWMRIYNARLRKNCPEYDRVFSQTELKYVGAAQEALKAYAEETKFSGVYWLYQMVYLPLLLSGFAVGYFAWVHVVKLVDTIETSRGNAEDNLYYLSPEVGVSGVIGVFTVIFLAGWLCYFLFSRHQNFQNYLVLKAPVHQRETTDVTLERRLAQIMHDVRIGKLDVLSSFSVSEFLSSIYRRHQRYLGISVLVIFIPMLVFLVFDLRYHQVFTKNSIQYSPYWSVNMKAIKYEELSYVAVECKKAKKRRREVSLIFLNGNDIIARIREPQRLPYMELEKLFQIDEILRAKNVDFTMHYWTPPKQPQVQAFSELCINTASSSVDAEHRTAFMRLMHASELEAKNVR